MHEVTAADLHAFVGLEVEIERWILVAGALVSYWCHGLVESVTCEGGLIRLRFDDEDRSDWLFPSEPVIVREYAE